MFTQQGSCTAHQVSHVPVVPTARRAAHPQHRGIAQAAVATRSVDTLGISALRLLRPSPAEIERLVAQEFSRRELNHGDAGASASAPDLPPAVKGRGYMITTNRRKVGQGRAAYDAAVAAINKWEQLQLGWNFTTKPSVTTGTKICSATQTVVPWSVLPAQVVYAREEEAADLGGGKTGRRYAVGLASLAGHLLAGEERFAVELHPDGSVWYEVFLFSKPSTVLAWASLPVIRLMQIRYVNDSIAALAATVA